MQKSELYSKLEPYKKTLFDIGPIIFRHVFLFVNGIIFTVVVLLFIFGNREAAIFLGIITFFNILLGIIQDTRARLALETLAMLTALRVVRVDDDGTETTILSEFVDKGDHIRLKLGDQVPCDGVLISASGLEVSQALITGESESLPRGKGMRLEAGDVITSGTGIIETENDFHESRVAKMTEEAKRYSASPSPIQRSINKVIKYAGYIMIVVIMVVVVRGYIAHETYLKIVMDIGALASTIIPQGLVVITTLLFAFGAATYSKKHVLFQEINATEKLGRIKNLCLDKTGTLTENFLTVKEIYINDTFSQDEVLSLTDLYLRGSGDSSQTAVAVKKYIDQRLSMTDGHGDLSRGIDSSGKIIGSLPFSSWRQYGVVEISSEGKSGSQSIFVGPADIFLQYFSKAQDRQWLTDILTKYAHTGKRLLCVAVAPDAGLPRDFSHYSKSGKSTNLSVVSVFVLESALREGIKNTIKFFQDRGVHLRIISGDNIDTVQTIAAAAGIKDANMAVTGREMEKWSDADFTEKTSQYSIFARITPEIKVKIIESLKKDGFTAMVGDGANDVLAIKRADLGIAMFDGVPAARHLAGVILMKNSFTDLPGAVELADNFIRNIEIFAGIFLNQSLLGLFFFTLISLFGYSYPLTPLNITLINYFAVGIPGMLIGYWAIRPSGKIIPTDNISLLRSVLPFATWSALIGAIGVSTVFILSPEHIRLESSNTLVAISYIVCALIFFALSPNVYRGSQQKSERIHLSFLILLEVIILYLALKIPFVIRFFDITVPLPSILEVCKTILILIIFGIVQYLIMKRFFMRLNKYAKIIP